MRILVVDDDRLNLKFADGYLKSYFSDYTVFLCQDPKQTINYLESEHIDIILLDIIMPEMSGIDVLRLVRSMEAYNDIQIIMLTSVNDKESFQTCFELGANDYLLKPIEVTEFKARISAAAKTRSSTRMLREMVGIMTTQNSELKALNALLKDSQYHLIQSGKMDAVCDLAANIGYEISVPVEQIYANLGLIEKYFNLSKEQNNNLPEDIDFEQIINDAKNDISKISETIQSLLRLSWVKSEDEKVPCILEDLVRQVIMIVANAAKNVVSITEDIMPLPEIYGNPKQIAHVILNIITNGIEAIRGQNKEEIGLIHINAYAEDRYVCIQISDNGPGIMENDIDKIFNPFFTTKEEGRGTGLGLSISYDIIVNKHKGFIDVQSQIDQGTTFTIKLPIEKQV